MVTPERQPETWIEFEMRPRVPYGRWLLSILSWDGALPVLAVLLPWIAGQIFPKRMDAAIGFLAVVFPIFALFARIIMADIQIKQHNVSDRMKSVQFTVAFISVVFLMLVECLIIGLQGLNIGWQDTFVFLLCVGVIYLPFAAFSMYPGKQQPQPLPTRLAVDVLDR